jgi:TolB protein
MGTVIRAALRLLALWLLLLEALFTLRDPHAEASLIAYDAGGEIAVMSADGSSHRIIAPHRGLDRDPAWSPTRMEIAFMSNRTGVDQVYVARWDGSALRALTDNSARNSYDRGFAWSPDGDHLLIANGILAFDTNLYIARADGRGRPRLTDYRDALAGVWSPDGAWIAYHADDDGDYDIYKMRPDGSGWQRLTNNTQNDFFPQWSPDGSQILFISTTVGNDMYLMDANGGSVRRLIETLGIALSPTWSPDGSQIAFTLSTATYIIDVCVARLDDGRFRCLNTGHGINLFPTWSPDGAWLALTIRVGGPNDVAAVYRIRPDGSGLQQLTDAAPGIRAPIWSASFGQSHPSGVLALLAGGLLIGSRGWRRQTPTRL